MIQQFRATGGCTHATTTAVFAPLIGLILAACACAEPAAKLDAGAFDAQLNAFIASGEFSGVVLVANDAGILYQRASGLADHEAASANTLRTRFHSAAVGETFIAAAIAALAAQDRLRPQDPVSRFLPNYPRGDEITLEMLLLHQSGIPDADALREHRSPRRDLAASVEHIAAHPLDFTPGSRGEYSSSGYVLLAYLVEAISGERFGDYVHGALLAPLGMHDTVVDDGRRIIERRARGYHPGPAPAGVNNLPRVADPRLPGSPAIYSTAADLLTWLRRQAADAAEVKGEFPWGWSPGQHDDIALLEQSGIGPGYLASVRRYPSLGLNVILLANLHALAPLQQLPMALANIARGRSQPVPVRPTRRPGISAAAHKGRYLFPGLGEFRLQATGSELYLRWLAFDAEAHLIPVGEGRFLNRKDGAVLQLLRHGDDTPGDLQWFAGNATDGADTGMTLCPRRGD